MSGFAPAITVRGLHKLYGHLEALCGIDFDVHQGEVFGLLGPNGAGKTTTIEILEGIRQRTSGQVRVLGFDPDQSADKIKDQIGVCLQATNLPDKCTVAEAIHLFASFYSRGMDPMAVLTRLQLFDKRNAFYGTLSGGQKQRLALALALINEPRLIFLDEPTTGLDPQVRLEVHELIEELRREKRTILLTTHYIEEAERLCDRVAIVDQGRVIALGSPREIQAKTLGHSRVEVITADPLPQQPAVACERIALSEDRRSIVAISDRPARTLADLVKWIDQAGIEIEDIHLKRPTLEDVFIELTGRRLRE